MSAPISLQIVIGLLMFALVFMPLERWFPARQVALLRSGWAMDVAFFVAGCFVAKFSDLISRAGALLLVRRVAGLNAAGQVASQPGWIQFLEILILADFLAYFYHRSLHGFQWLWHFHEIHHSSSQMDWLANVRLHPIDKTVGDYFQFIPIFWLGFSDAALLAYTIVLGFQGFLNHSNIKVDYGPLRWIIASPQFHHWHHDNDTHSHNKNFSPHLVIFDLLFGTFYLPADRALPVRYGIPEAIPEQFWAQVLYPFRCFHSSPELALPADIDGGGDTAQPRQGSTASFG